METFSLPQKILESGLNSYEIHSACIFAARQGAQVSVRQLARIMGISPTTACRCLRSLRQKGIISDKFHPEGSTGVPPQKHPVPPQKHPVPPQKHPVPPQKHPVPPQKHPVPPQKQGVSEKNGVFPPLLFPPAPPLLTPKTSALTSNANVLEELWVVKGKEGVYQPELLELLFSLKNWVINQHEDPVWLLDFKNQYPAFNQDELKACRDYWDGKHDATSKGDWKNRLRNWMKKSQGGNGHGRTNRDRQLPAKYTEMPEYADIASAAKV